MNEERLIDSLKRLRKFGPSAHELSQIYLEMRKGRQQSSPPTAIRRKKIAAIVFFAVIALTVGVWGNTLFVVLQPLLFKTEIFLTSNPYDKAALALNLTGKQLAELQSGKLSGHAEALAAERADAWLAETNNYVNGLQISGVSGSYSREQCLALYVQYDQLLSEASALTPRSENVPAKDRLNELGKHARSYASQLEAKLEQSIP